MGGGAGDHLNFINTICKHKVASVPKFLQSVIFCAVISHLKKRIEGTKFVFAQKNGNFFPSIINPGKSMRAYALLSRVAFAFLSYIGGRVFELTVSIEANDKDVVALPDICCES